jgi:hypothetical protein
MRTKKHYLAPAALLICVGGLESRADLANSYQFNGNGNWSLDAVGQNSTPVGFLDALVPAGSTVVKAFLYSAATPNQNLSSLTFDGTVINVGDFTFLGSHPTGMRAWRTDVTAQVAAKIGGGSAVPFQFAINSETPNSGMDGEILAIVYSNPAETERTIAFLDGFSVSTAQHTEINLSSPLPDPTQSGFEALMSLGIGFSFQNGGVQQQSTVDINGRRLTSAAGGEDDGFSSNGGLITVGGLGDSALNPVNPNAVNTGPRSDDELYNLALGNGVNPLPFITQGDTVIKIDTRNASTDDNIFFIGLNLTARAGVDQPPPPPVDNGPAPVPEVGTTASALAFAGLSGFAWLRRRKQA